MAKNYDSIGEFREKENATYQLIARRGLLKELTRHMKRESRLPISNEELAAIASKYDVLREFREKDTVMYTIIHKRGLFNELCGHMKREVPKGRSDKELADIASRYTIAKEFREKEPSVYAAIVDRGLTEKLCGHMQYEVRKDMSDEMLAEIASRYDTLKDFRKCDGSAYTLIIRRGLYDKLCGHMEREVNYYTEEELAERAKKFKHRIDFYNQDRKAYDSAHARGLLDKICAHMERLVKPVGYWTKERCQKEAKKYKTKEEFRKGNKSAHGAAQKNGWLDEICSHMEAQGNWFNRKIYAFTFSDGYAYIGLTQDPEDRYKQHTSPQERNTPVYKHLQKTGSTFEYKLLTDWLPKVEAAKVEDEYIRKYKADGWKMLNRMKGGGLGGTTKVYTDERIKREVAKYEYVDDFMKGSPGYYKYIHRHHLMDKYCSDLKFKNKPNGYWTLERAMKTASEYDSPNELRKKYAQAYTVLLNAGKIDECYPDKGPKITWTLEKSLSVIPLCKSRKELQQKYQTAYNVLLRAGVLNDYFPIEWRPFTLEEKMAMITECKTRMELRSKHRSVYDWAIKNGLIDKYLPKKKRG